MRRNAASLTHIDNFRAGRRDLLAKEQPYNAQRLISPATVEARGEFNPRATIRPRWQRGSSADETPPWRPNPASNYHWMARHCLNGRIRPERLDPAYYGSLFTPGSIKDPLRPLSKCVRRRSEEVMLVDDSLPASAGAKESVQSTQI